MKVSEMPYEHINFEVFEKNALEIINGVRNAKSADEVLEWRKKYLGLVIEYSTAMNISYIRYSCNTADEFYVKENDYFDEIGPQVGNLMNNYNDALLNSPFRAELEEKLSPVYFKHMEVQAKAMSPEIIEDMIEENKIVSEYSKLMAGMEFEFRGEKLSRAALAGPKNNLVRYRYCYLLMLLSFLFYL